MCFFLAHQGGWDEILYLAIPAIGVLFFVRWAERKARGRAEGDEPAAATSIPEDSDPT